MASRLPDENAARKLFLYAANHPLLYAQRARPIIRALALKVRRGQYDAAKALPAWERYAAAAAQEYSREYSDGRDGLRMFDAPTRRAVAAMLEAKYENEAHDAAALGPMTRNARGVVKQNPAKKRAARGRSKGPLNRVSQATGAAPSARLVKRRRATKAAPKGFYANPAKVRMLRDEHFAAGPLFRVYEKRRTADLGIVSDWNPIATFDDLAKAKEYAKAYADAHNRQVVIAGNFAGVPVFRNKRVAR